MAPSLSETIGEGAWNVAKVAAFRDAFFAFTEHVYINSKDTGGHTRLSDNIYYAQRRFLDTVFDGLANDIHDFKVLKSRQLGMSTITRALTIFWLGLHDGLQGALIYDTDSNKEVARAEIKSTLENLPPKLGFPRIKSENRYGLRLSNDSFLRFMSAGVRSNRSSGTLGRSSGINFVHGSEMCSWENPEGIVSLKQALSDKYKDRLYIWESTARGFNDWWSMWQDAKSDTLTQRTVFIGWWAREDQRFAAGTPAFERYGEEPPTPDEQRRIDEVREKYGYEVGQEQLAWYRWKSNPGDDDLDEEIVEGGDDFLQQDQPWTEEEAFIQTGSTFFPSEKLTGITKNDVRADFKAYSYLAGTEFIYSDVVVAENRRMTHLKVWEEPDDNGVYVISGDPAFGHDEKNDRSACQVIRCYADCCEQVAEFASATFQAHQFAWVLMSLAAWYKNSRIILEMNGPGDAVFREIRQLPQLVERGYLSKMAEKIGIRNIFHNVKQYIYTKTDAMGAGHVFQWKTNQGLKVAIFERMRDFASNGGLIIRSSELVEEMKTVRREGDTIKAEGRNKDDRTFAMAMAIRCWEQTERRSLIGAGKTREMEVARRRFTLQDQLAMLNKYKIEQMFRQKAAQRRDMAHEMRRASWRSR